jgi:hypothetical protein
LPSSVVREATPPLCLYSPQSFVPLSNVEFVIMLAALTVNGIEGTAVVINAAAAIAAKHLLSFEFFIKITSHFNFILKYHFNILYDNIIVP